MLKIAIQRIIGEIHAQTLKRAQTWMQASIQTEEKDNQKSFVNKDVNAETVNVRTNIVYASQLVINAR